MTSNLGKFSISCKVLIMGNPYSSTEIPLEMLLNGNEYFYHFENYFNSAVFSVVELLLLLLLIMD